MVAQLATRAFRDWCLSTLRAADAESVTTSWRSSPRRDGSTSLAQAARERVHHVRVATETIQRGFRDIGVPHLVKTRRRRPKQLKLFEKERQVIPSKST